MSLIRSLFSRALGPLTRIPLVSPKAMLIGARALGTIPAVLFLYHSIQYYADFLQTQSPQFYDPFHYEVYDFIVVGGGSAGAVVANRLSKNNRVLLLEQGGDPNPLSYIPASASILQRASSTDLMYETVPQNYSCRALKNHVMFWPRGTGIGGSSNLNFMIYQRGNPSDYDNWANITRNPDWAYENVLPFFRKLEDYNGAYPNAKYHGKGGPLHVEKVRQSYMEKHFLEAAREKGFPIHDTNARQGEGFGEMDVTHQNGLRWSTYPAYIRPILGRGNLRIHRYSRVVKIHLDQQKNAYGLTYFRHGMKKFVRARKEIIISTGAVDTPKLLLLSGIGPRNHLHAIGLKCRVHLAGVGRNLQDHVYSMIGPFTFNGTERGSLVATRDSNLQALMQFTHNATGPLVSISTISAVGHVSTPQNPQKSWPDIQYFLVGLGPVKGVGRAMEQIMNIKGDLFEEYMAPHSGKDANFVLQVRPKSSGYIELKGKDPFLKPLIQPNYYKEEADVKAMVEGVKFIVDMYENTTTYRRLGAKLVSNLLPGCSHHKPRSDSYYACYVRSLSLTLYHPVGTARMGHPSQLNSTEPPVVDSELRVLKTRGLRVIDASVMSQIVNSNTNVPSILIGEVGSSFIRRHWARQYRVSVRTWPWMESNCRQCFYSQIP